MDQVALEWTCDTQNNKKIGKEVKREGKGLKFISGKKTKNKKTPPSSLPSSQPVR